MKKTLGILAALLILLGLCAEGALASSPVPGQLPADLGGKTLYGYLTGLKKDYLPAKVFTDPLKYGEADRENARRAIRLIVAAVDEQFGKAGKADQYNLYLRGNCYEQWFLDTGDPLYKEKALSDYRETVALGGAYAQADYDRTAALEARVFPTLWEVPQALTPDEMAALLGLAPDAVDLMEYAHKDPVRGLTGVVYGARDAGDPQAGGIVVTAEHSGGRARFELYKSFAALGRVAPLPGVGDEAFLCGLNNLQNSPLLYRTAVVRKGELVLKAMVPAVAWAQGPGRLDAGEIAFRIASALLSNIADGSRPIPVPESFAMEQAAAPFELPSGLPGSPVPDVPDPAFGGKTAYGYIMDLKQAYLPADVFSDAGKYTDADRNDARRALKLVVGMISDGFDKNGVNMYELEIRAACYALAYEDSGDARYRELALNDYKKALSFGYTLARKGYDRLAAGILAPFAELKEGSSGERVALLQRWLEEAGYPLADPAGDFGAATKAAVMKFEGDNALTPDGIADISFLSLLWSRVERSDDPLR